jgi:hypothetical protein
MCNELKARKSCLRHEMLRVINVHVVDFWIMKCHLGRWVLTLQRNIMPYLLGKSLLHLKMESLLISKMSVATYKMAFCYNPQDII